MTNARISCSLCRKTYQSKDSLRGHMRRHKKKGHGLAKDQFQIGKGPKLGLVLQAPKTADEIGDAIANEHLDDNKHLYDDETWKNLKYKANNDDDDLPYKRFRPNPQESKSNPEEAKSNPKKPKTKRKGSKPRPPRKNQLKCGLCSERFANERDRAVHMAEQHPACINCRKRFPTRKEFLEHHHPTCGICGMVFFTDQDLNDHLMIHPKCQRCGAIFVKASELKVHIMRKHGRTGKTAESSSQLVKCPVCSKDVKARFIDQHIRQHRRSRSPNDRLSSEDNLSDSPENIPLPESDSENRPFVPNELSADERSSVKTVDSEDGAHSGTELAENIPLPESGNENDRRPFVPHELSTDERSSVKTVETSSGDDDESSMVSIPSSQQKKCPRCYRKFASESKLDEHYREEHPVFMCGICEERFASQRLLDQHIDLEHAEMAGPSNWKPEKEVYQCKICKDILKTKEGYLEHMRNHQRYDCKMCASSFDTAVDRDIHMSMNHPKCMLCDIAFATTEEYMRHKLMMHPEDREYRGPRMPSDTEDEIRTDEESIDAQDRMFDNHINCITIGRFYEIYQLIEGNQFDTLFNDDELLEALQIIFKGVLKGYIPICAPQRQILTGKMRKLLNTFGANANPRLLMRNKKTLKELFKVLWDSVKTVIDSFMKFSNK